MGLVELVVMLAMIAFNSVFAAFELALAAISIARLKLLEHENRLGARAAVYMKENVEGSLAAIQIGINLFGAVAAAVGGAGAEEQIAPWLVAELGMSEGASEFVAIASIVLPLTAVTIIFGELVPKVFALRNKEWVCLRLSPVMYWFTLSVWPAVWLFETIVTGITDWGQSRFANAEASRHEATELQELRAVASLARMTRLIGAGEERIIHGAARLASQKVGEIMLPASAISMLDANASLADSLVAAHLDMHTRFPVTEAPGDPQQIAGYVNVKDLVAVMRLSPTNPSVRAIVRPIVSFRVDDSIARCLEHLLRESSHISLVRDAAGTVVGMVTLEDIIEELLGEIKDEYDKLPIYTIRSGRDWVVGGGIGLAKLRDLTGIDLTTDLPPAGAESLNDWLIGHQGREIRGGDALVRGGVRVLVRKIRRKQVMEALVGVA